MATTEALTENSRQGINFQIPPYIGLDARLSPNLRPGCGHAYDETPVGLVVYVRNDPVNFIDPDGRLAMAPEAGPRASYFVYFNWDWWDPPPSPTGSVDPVDGGPRSGGPNGWGPYHRDRVTECRKIALQEGARDDQLPDATAANWIMTAYVTFGVDPAIISAIWFTETSYSMGLSPNINRDENGNKTSTDWGPLQLNDHYKLSDPNWQNKYNPSGTDLTQDPWAAFFVAANDLADHGAGKQNPNLVSAITYWHGLSFDTTRYAGIVGDAYIGIAQMFECMKAEK